MIRLRMIKQAITAMLNKKFPSYKVYWDNVDKAQAPYFYCEMNPLINTVDTRLSERNIQIDIMGVLPLDKYGKVNRTELYDMQETLDLAIRPVFRIRDRYITILSAEMTVVDDVSHYIFTLEFADAWTDEDVGFTPQPLMANLEVELKTKGNN